MPDLMPQELAVWYIIPSIRKELSKELIAKGLTQKKAAQLLGLTESAVSQYLKAKRAKGVSFNPEAAGKIKLAAGKIIKDEKNAKKYIYRLSNELMKSKEACRIHMKHDKSLKKGCNICFEK